MRVLLDEHISPTIVHRLAQLGIYAQSVPHVGLSSQSDLVIWQYALKYDFTVVTTNARDFIDLVDVELHPGIIALRESGLNRDTQWMRLEPLLQHILRSGDPDFMVNKLAEITGPETFQIRQIP